MKVYEVYETESSIYIVMELIEGKPLQQLLKTSDFRKKYSCAQIAEMMRSILDALACMAAKSVVHRDLKPDNILFDKDGNIKIVDFGLASYLDEAANIYAKCGTPGYIAPEVFKYNPSSPETAYNTRCDVFSAGCILYYM